MSPVKTLLSNRRVLKTALVIMLVALFGYNQYIGNQGATGDIARLQQAISNQQSDVQVQGEAKVIKLLADDNRGSRHQRFLIKLDSGEVILIAHNIDLAPKIDALREGDRVGFNGEFEWNDKGGVIHWTHRDPGNRHIHGYLTHHGEKYW